MDIRLLHSTPETFHHLNQPTVSSISPLLSIINLENENGLLGLLFFLAMAINPYIFVFYY